MKNIQVLKPYYEIEECLQEIRECLEIGWTGIGFKTNKFEDAWREYTGFSNAYFVNSATAGLHLAIKILKQEYGWDDGDEVLTTPLTFVSTNHAILYENLKPVFVDVDDYLCLNPDDIKNKITSKTKAVMFVGLGGSTGQYEKIVKLCKKHNLKLILDAAHMAGTRLRDEIPGKEADCVVYSFQAVKNLPTADAGMVCFKSDILDSIARKIGWLGINKDTYKRASSGKYKWKYDVEYVGYKYHGNSIIAGIGLAQLKYLDKHNEYRRMIARLYTSKLNNSNNIDIIPIPYECLSSYHLYVIRVDNRDDVLYKLNERGIFPGVHYIDNTEYEMYSYAYGTCPNAHKLQHEILTLPINLHMTVNEPNSDVNYISDTLLNIIGG